MGNSGDRGRENKRSGSGRDKAKCVQQRCRGMATGRAREQHSLVAISLSFSSASSSSSCMMRASNGSRARTKVLSRLRFFLLFNSILGQTRVSLDEAPLWLLPDTPRPPRARPASCTSGRGQLSSSGQQQQASLGLGRRSR